MKNKLTLEKIIDDIRYFDICWKGGYYQFWPEDYKDIISELKRFISENNIADKITQIFANYIRNGGSDDIYDLTKKEIKLLVESTI